MPSQLVDAIARRLMIRVAIRRERAQHAQQVFGLLNPRNIGLVQKIKPDHIVDTQRVQQQHHIR